MPTLNPFEIGVRYKGDASGVELLPEMRPIEYERRGEYIYFKTEPLHVFDMYRILK
jgi:hypothetical protein